MKGLISRLRFSLLLAFFIVISIFMLSSCAVKNNSQQTSSFVHDFKTGEENHYGSTTESLQNNGYVAFQSDWVYYSYRDSYQLMKMKKDGSKKTIIFEKPKFFNFHDIQVVGDWVYFMAELGSPSNSDGYQFYKIKTDGSEQTLLINGNNHTLNTPFVVGDIIYYVVHENIDSKTWTFKIIKMTTKSSDNIVLFTAKDHLSSIDCSIDILSVNDNGIYFMENDPHGYYGLAIWHVNLDGSNPKQLTQYEETDLGSDGKRIDPIYFEPILIGDQLFYWDNSHISTGYSNVYCLDIKSLKTTLLLQNVDAKILNIIGNYYIGSYNDKLSYFSKDIKTHSNINTDQPYDVYTNGEWIYYGHLFRIKQDGSGWEQINNKQNN